MKVPLFCFLLTVWLPTEFDRVLKKQTSFGLSKLMQHGRHGYKISICLFVRFNTAAFCGDTPFWKPRRFKQIVSQIYVSSLCKSQTSLRDVKELSRKMRRLG